MNVQEYIKRYIDFRNVGNGYFAVYFKGSKMLIYIQIGNDISVAEKDGTIRFMAEHNIVDVDTIEESQDLQYYVADIGYSKEEDAWYTLQYKETKHFKGYNSRYDAIYWLLGKRTLKIK